MKEKEIKDVGEIPLSIETVRENIYIIRGQKVMLDRDLARMYGVKTMRLNEAVKRNIKRFPEDFMFQLSKDEVERCSKSQFVILNELENDEPNLISQIAISSFRPKNKGNLKSQIATSNIKPINNGYLVFHEK